MVVLAGLIAFVVVLSAIGTGTATRSPGPLPPLGLRSPTAPAVVAPPAAGVPPAGPAPSAYSENWYNLTGNYPYGVPGNRTFAAQAFDPSLNGTVLFGGFDQAAYTADSDTWLFANGTFTNLTLNLSGTPPARWAADMAWDPTNSELVMFGGRSTVGGPFADTWVLNNSVWTNVTPGTSPSGRQSQFSVFTWDPTLHADYLFGGSCYVCGGSGVEYNDSWAFVNGTWKNVTSSVTGSPALLDFGAWDPLTTGILGYTTNSTNCSGGGSTVSFNGSAWKVLNATSPPGSVPQGGGLAYDGVDSTMILFGGGWDLYGQCQYQSNTWSYGSSGKWVNLTSTLTSAPSQRCCESFSYDPVQRVILFEGGSTPQVYVGDTWTFPAIPLNVQFDNATRYVGISDQVNFSASVLGGAGTLTDSWNFGDGSANASGASASHSYAATGAYNVTFAVVDSQGREVNRTLVVDVFTALSAGASGAPSLGEAPVRVNFTANTAGGLGPFQFSWTFGDQSNGSGANASHVYLAKGNYVATVTVRDVAHQVSRATVNVSVAAPLGTGILTSPLDGIGDAPLRVNFTAQPTGIESPFRAIWTFGDGSATAMGLNVSHVYPAFGTFRANVTVTDVVGHEANASIAVVVHPALSANASAVKTAGFAPFSVTFAGFAEGGTAPFAYSWSFGDGSANTTAAAPTHVYTNPGLYTAQFTTTDAAGGRVVRTVQIDAVTPLDAAAQANVTSGAVPLWVTFSAPITGGLPPVTYSWLFGDGGASTLPNVTHEYTSVAEYPVTLTVTDGLGETVHRALTVDVFDVLRATVSANPATIAVGQSTNFTASVSGGSGGPTYLWASLPPGCTSSNGPMDECAPTTAGTYNVTVSIRDSRNDPATASVELTVGPASSTSQPTGLGTRSLGASLTLELIGIAAAAGILGAIAVLFLLRRRGSPG
ncbi:MAG: PKD domain-containing protein, partial [Candidatus Lutacidiplasmatales archaeon]